MIFQLIVGPFSTLHTLPRGMSFLLISLTAVISGTSLGITGVQAGKTRMPEVANLCISFAFTVLSLMGFVWQFAWHRLEDNFDSLPWLPEEGEKEGLPCPFTGKRPSKRCPNCGCLVHATAFHTQERLTTFYVGESVLAWEKANYAGNLISAPVEGRALLDEALDCRGNYYFACTGNSCVGCSSFHRSFRMLPRWALCLACIACVSSLVPWAFKRSLETVNHGGKVQAIAETYGVFFSLTAVFIQLHAISCAIIFMTTYQSVLSFPSPLVVPRKGILRRVVEFMAGQPVSEASNWQLDGKSLPDTLKDFTEGVANLPARLERRMQAMQDDGKKLRF